MFESKLWWKLKLVFWDDEGFQTDRGSIGCSCMSVQRMPPFTNARHPQLDPCDPSMNVPEARGVRGREVRGSLGVFTLWLLQRGCPCQRVAMATLFDSYNNARAPLLPPTLHFWATHTHKRGLCDWKITLGITAKWLQLILKRLTMPMQIKS